MKPELPPFPIFIHGILPRSGTNFLNQVLLIHPDCEQPSSRIRENWMLHYSDLLIRYSDSLRNIWSNPRWGGDDIRHGELLERMGGSLLDYLLSQSQDPGKKVMITKTPSVVNLKNIDHLFPEVRNVIIVRDPLDVAASTFKSWKVPVDETLVKWNEACRHIYEFEKNTKSSYYLIRYEDLLRDPVSFLAPCLGYLGLDASHFTPDSISALPVFGSSDGGPKWEVRNKQETFQPVGRWKSLPERQAELAKKYHSAEHARYFGYPGILDGKGISPLPDVKDRLTAGDRILGLNGSRSATASGTRIKNLKEGVKLIVRSMKG